MCIVEMKGFFMKHLSLYTAALAVAAACLSPVAIAHGHDHKHVEHSGKDGKGLDAHTREDIERHRAMARAHERAAQCLEEGRTHNDCTKSLQTDCKGLALGKHCGMRHAH